MLKLNEIKKPKKEERTDLNTSHVKVKRVRSDLHNIIKNLNTSHVKVKPNSVNQNESSIKFKYISC